MTDLRDLLFSQRDVAVFPDPETSAKLRKARDFWTEEETLDIAHGPDLSALSDTQIHEQLAALGVRDTDIPVEIRDLVAAPRARRLWRPGLAVAACLAGGVALGILGTTLRESRSTAPVLDQQAASGSHEGDAHALDPYLLRPGGPAPQITMPDEAGPALRTVRLPGRSQALDLSRTELRELQSLLNRFGYGPIPQHGLSSDDTDAAIARFRRDHDLAEGGADGIVLGILREIAHQEAVQNLKSRINSNHPPE